MTSIEILCTIWLAWIFNLEQIEEGLRLRKPEHPPSLGEILNRRGAELAPAFGDDRYQTLARRAEKKYIPWSKLRYRAVAEGLDPELLWAIVKVGRIPQYRNLPLSGQNGRPLMFTMPDVLQEELMLIDRQLAGRIISRDDQPLSAAHQERFIISALREEAIASSMLEGAATTRREAKDMLASGRRPRTRGERMVVNNYSAMTYIREHRTSPLTPDFLLHLQRILTEGTLDDESQIGRFRTVNDRIDIVDQYGEIIHTPPPADELSWRLKQLCDYANGKTDPSHFVHPVIKACAIHFQIGFDHPFCDGNGRTARALFYWAMLQAGYWLFEYLPISGLIYAGPSKYVSAFLHTETDEFDLTHFLVYKAKVISRARKQLSEYIAKKQMEITAGRKVFESDHRLNHRQRDVILRMLRNPDLHVTVVDHQTRHNVAFGTARSDLFSLAEWKYVTKQLVGARRYIFVRGPKLEQAIAVE